MRFNWTFLPTVTIDLQNEKASDMPPLADKNGRFLGLFRDEPGRLASVVDRPYSADDCDGAALSGASVLDNRTLSSRCART